MIFIRVMRRWPSESTNIPNERTVVARVSFISRQTQMQLHKLQNVNERANERWKNALKEQQR